MIVAKIKKKADYLFKTIDDYLKISKIYYKIAKNEVTREAAALTFITVLSFIPFLMLMFFVLPDIPGIDIKGSLQELFLSILLPDSVEVGSEHISQILDQKLPSNIFNIALLLVTSFTLFKFINSTFDKILDAQELKSNNIFYKMSRFVSMIIFGFVFILVLFSSTSVSLIALIFDFPVIRNISFIIIPFIMFFLVNSLIYFFATSKRLKAKSLIIGSVLSSIIWIFVKIVFDFYIANLTNMEVVYGVIATLPILLFWIYLNWLIILLGVVFIATIEENN